MSVAKLPEGYRLSGVIDLERNKRQLRAVAKLSLILLCVMIVFAVALLLLSAALRAAARHVAPWLVGCGAALVYIPLHELMHALPMWIAARQKVSFGISWKYAYAGSEAYFTRAEHNFIALLPVIFFGALCAFLMYALPQKWFWAVYLVQIGNLSGAAGDIWCVWHLRTAPKDALVRDTGTRMQIFTRRKA